MCRRGIVATVGLGAVGLAGGGSAAGEVSAAGPASIRSWAGKGYENTLGNGEEAPSAGEDPGAGESLSTGEGPSTDDDKACTTTATGS